NLKRDVMALWLAARDPRTPLAAKLVAAAVSAYALSPIDLIPDVIPVLGLLDDLLILPLGPWLAIKLIPPPLMQEVRDAAAAREKPGSRAGVMLVAALWIAGAAALAWLAWVWLQRA